MQDNKGIWKHAFRWPLLDTKFQLSLGEGDTTLKEIDDIYFKMENQNPTGSVKDRGIAYQLSHALASGHRAFVISSSGNAAISASVYCRKAELPLEVFVSPKTAKGKMERLEKEGAKVTVTSKPVSAAVRKAHTDSVYNLRASTDPLGWVGYSSIAFELSQQLPEIGSVFIPVSSGTLALGVAKGLEMLNKRAAINIVQTPATPLIAKEFDKEYLPNDTSLADALVAKVSTLKEEVVDLVKMSGGWGWIVEDEKIQKAQDWMSAQGLRSSYEGAACLAALHKAKEKGSVLGKSSVVLLTGSVYAR